MISARRYTTDDAQAWNEFVKRSKNGTFLFDRNYMDYHADRFHDHSILFFQDGKLYALLPANELEGRLFSHAGLSYGGLVMSADCTAAGVLAVFEELKAYLQKNGFRELVYKAMPWCYHVLPSQEDLYALYRVFPNGLQLQYREIATLLVQRTKMRWRKDRRRALLRAQRDGLVVAENQDFSEFWQMLEHNLREKYHDAPVHSLQEITLLKSRFPDSIRLYEARREGELMGGLVVYLTPQVVRGQYSSASDAGKQVGAMDIIKDHLLNHLYQDVPYFDFGNSTLHHGNYLNESLIAQKEGFGGRAICYDTYLITL